MALHFFSIPALNGAAEQDALNRFCASHSVVTLEHQLVQAGAASFWAVAVTVRDGPTALERSAPQRTGAKVDYKEVLNEADFRLYSALRELRKTVAQQEGVAVYAVFTNDQLAAMVTGRVATPTALREIEGVGPARVDKYGATFLAPLRAAFEEARP